MAAPPNKRHSEYLWSLCNDCDLIEPFRFFNPNRKEFTFTPRDILKKNRSRIDFFLVSDYLVNKIGKIEISQTLQSNLFDHKAVILDFNKQHNGISRPCISNSILDDKNLDLFLSSNLFKVLELFFLVPIFLFCLLCLFLFIVMVCVRSAFHAFHSLRVDLVFLFEREKEEREREREREREKNR